MFNKTIFTYHTMWAICYHWHQYCHIAITYFALCTNMFNRFLFCFWNVIWRNKCYYVINNWTDCLLVFICGKINFIIHFVQCLFNIFAIVCFLCQMYHFINNGKRCPNEINNRGMIHWVRYRGCFAYCLMINLLIISSLIISFMSVIFHIH